MTTHACTSRTPAGAGRTATPATAAAVLARSLVCIGMLALLGAIGLHAGNLHAQACSGGPAGGTDATGHQCRDGDAFVAPATAREQGLAAYERGHYAAALGHFRDAALAGDPRSAEILALMYRFGPRMFGPDVPADPVAAARWAAVAAERQASAVMAGNLPAVRTGAAR